jgi:hypothetical protein
MRAVSLARRRRYALSSSGHSTCFWETKRAFVFSYGPGVPTVIPKGAFTSEPDLADARALLAATFGRSER